MTTIQPVNNHILIEHHEVTEATTSFGIIIPQSAQERITKGTIITDPTNTYPAGTTVLYARYGGVSLEIDNHNYVLIKPHEILAIINE